LRRDWRCYLKEYFKKPWFAVPFVGLALTVVFYFASGFGVVDFFIATVLAFIASDVLMWILVRGGGGIFQARLFGSKTQPKGYGFIFFFASIVFIAVVINWLTDITITFLQASYSDPTVCIVVGLVLVSLVYLIVHVRFYSHRKRD
jgi:uncharacterized membrane protein